MKVNIVECFAGVRRAKGLAVIIDVFRSSTVACYLAAGDRGGDYIVTDSPEQAKALARKLGGKVLGELEGVGAEVFDYDNSPHHLGGLDLTGQALVHVTNAGTWGMVHCEADEVLVGSFVNAGAVVEYIRRQNPETVTLVAMGTNGDMRAQEDMMCAMYIKNALEAYPNSFKTLKSFLAGVDSAAKFFDPARTDCPEEDYDLCMDLDRFDFVLKVEPAQGGVRFQKIGVPVREAA